MGRGRAPCCDKSKVKRGPWSPAEDLRLISFIQKFGHDNWRSLPKQAGLMRCGKSCRLRWINYLRPDVKRGNFSKEEEDTIISLHNSIGNKWSRIAAHLPGRTDNEIKNVWNTYLKKRLSNPPSHDSSSLPHSPSPSSSSSTVDKVNNAPLPPSVSPKPVPPPTHNTLRDSSTSTISSVSAQEYGSVCNFDPDPFPGESLFDLLGPGSENTLGEVDKPYCFLEDNNTGMELPLELDYDFWNLFDNLEPTRPCAEAMDACGANLWGEEIQSPGEIAEENRNWLRRLEEELGLEVSEEDSSVPRDDL
ncbi:hypothetical protein MLD38_021933 [Melastoma candidum]|uniref:Uncharacterized protein n=1 Tax=Melastoma candidum TaxID=119954 RepID=A0ACB9QLI3_9MYRT|nr:hypothetical protein MLD38_021933 [Melastoma candidum]